MKSKKYIVVVPMVETELALLQFSENRYTWVPFWDDLRELNSKCMFDEFKIFVDQEEPRSSPPKLFVCTLIDAESVEKAYEQAIEAIRALSSELVTLFGRGFELMEHEAMVVGLTPIIKDTVDVKLIELTIKNGNVERIATPYGAAEPGFSQPISFSHNEYVTTHSKLQKIEGDMRSVQFPVTKMVPKQVLLNIEANLKRRGASRSNDERQLMNVMTSLYSAANATTNIKMSYLLLWQILESCASSKDYGSKLLTDNTMNSVMTLLQKENYDDRARDRVGGALGTLRKKNDNEVIAEIFREYVLPAESVKALKQKVKKFSDIRSAIVHPKYSRRLDANKLLTNYGKLSDIIYELLRKLGRSDSYLEAWC